jgi:hypothetical protein
MTFTKFVINMSYEKLRSLCLPKMSTKHVNILIGLQITRHCVEHDTLIMRGSRDQTEINTITIHYSTNFAYHCHASIISSKHIFILQIDIPVDVNEVMKENYARILQNRTKKLFLFLTP